MNFRSDFSRKFQVQENIGIIGFLACIGIMLATVFYYQVNPTFSTDRFHLHLQIIEGNALSPYLYRILVPYTSHGLYWLLRLFPFLTVDQAFKLTYWIIESVLLGTLLVAMYYFLRIWTSKFTAFLGSIFVALTIPLTFINQYYQPWSYAEVIFLILMVFAARRQSYLSAAGIVLLATLNRETGFLTVLIFFLISIDLGAFIQGLRNKRIELDWKVVGWAAFYSLIWLAVFLGLRLWRGPADAVISQTELMTVNFGGFALIKAALNWLIFFNFFWWFSIQAIKKAPRELRQLVIFVPVYLLAVGIWAVWIEVRLLMPLYIVVIPLGLLYLDQNILPIFLEKKRI